MKVFTISLCYNDPHIIRDSIDQYYATHDSTVETVHILVDQHWPIDYPECRKELENIARDHRCILMDPGKNLGLHRGFEWARTQFAIPDNAMVIGYDPDSWPGKKGWDRAMGEVFDADPTVAWLSLFHQHAERELFEENRKKEELVIAGHRVVVPKSACLNSVCGFRQGWLRAIGGLFEKNAFYGGLEVHMFPKLEEHKMRQVFLRDWSELPHFENMQNPLYRDWKYRTCHVGDIPHTVDFGTWIKSGASK